MMNKAVAAQIITEAQAQQLMDFLKNLPEQGPAFNLTNVLYYLGGLIAIAAMTILMTLGWQLYNTTGLLLLSISYAGLGLSLAYNFQSKKLAIPAGICATFTICLVPLFMYSLQKILGLWPENSYFFDYTHTIKWNWITMELGTLVIGTILARIYRYPFMLMPIAITLWYMSLDITAMIYGSLDIQRMTLVSMYFGLVNIVIAFIVDIRSRETQDYAFWLYIFSVFTFWSGLSAQYTDSELSQFFYMIVNVVIICVGVILNRKVFVLFGALGGFIYLTHLAFQVFQYSYLFPVVLTVIGMAIIYLGIIWQKYEKVFTQKMRSFLPVSIQALLESREE